MSSATLTTKTSRPETSPWAFPPHGDLDEGTKGSSSRCTYSRVLCATDLSPTGDSAVALAYRMTAPGGSVRVLHVYEPPHAQEFVRQFPTSLPPTAAEAIDACEKRAREHLDRLPFRAGRPDVITAEALFHHPNAAVAIEEQARADNCDVIVIGAHGRTGLGRLLMGSVALEVLKRSRIPVVMFHSSRVGS